MEGVAWSAQQIPTAVNLDFLERTQQPITCLKINYIFNTNKESHNSNRVATKLVLGATAAPPPTGRRILRFFRVYANLNRSHIEPNTVVGKNLQNLKIADA
jgi:hypothetical protein